MSQNSNKRNPVISDVKITKKGVDEALAAGNTHARFKNRGVQRRLLKNQELVRKEQERKDTAARHRAKFLKKAKEAKDLITQPAAPAVVDDGAKALLSLFNGIPSAEAIVANQAEENTSAEFKPFPDINDPKLGDGLLAMDSSSNVARMREAIQNQRADIGYGQVDVDHLDSNFGVQQRSQDEDGDGIILTPGSGLHRALSNIPKYTINNGEVALNLYGDESNYRPFPEIGDSIRADGIVSAVRPVEQDPSLEELKKMVEPNIITDKITYSAPGVVVDNKDDIVVQLEPSPSIESQGLASMGAMPPDDIIFDLRNPKLIDRYGMASMGEQPSSLSEKVEAAMDDHPESFSMQRDPEQVKGLINPTAQAVLHEHFSIHPNGAEHRPLKIVTHSTIHDSGHTYDYDPPKHVAQVNHDVEIERAATGTPNALLDSVVVVNHETGLKHFGLKQEVGPESVLHLNPWERSHCGSRKQMFASDRCEEIPNPDAIVSIISDEALAEYGIGVETNTVFTSMPDVTEDGIRIVDENDPGRVGLLLDPDFKDGAPVLPPGFKLTDAFGGAGVIVKIYPHDEDQLMDEAAAISAGSGEFCPAAAMSEAETNRMIHGDVRKHTAASDQAFREASEAAGISYANNTSLDTELDLDEDNKPKGE